MFKNAFVFRVNYPVTTLEAFSECLAGDVFMPCGATQEKSVGWVPPRGEEHGLFAEQVNGQLIVKLMIETKTVPAAAIKKAVDAVCKQVEAQTGRKPGKKERRELSDDARLALLPHAFPRQVAALAWFDRAYGRLVIDAGSQSVVDDFMSAMVRAVDGFTAHFVNTAQSPASVMSTWLYDGDKLSSNERFDFDIGRGCQLKACDETKAVVTYKKHALDTDEVRGHIAGGKRATRLDLTYKDRVAFTLTEFGTLAGIQFLDEVFDGSSEHAADAFDADVALMTGELRPLLNDLVEALGGEAATDLDALREKIHDEHRTGLDG